MATKTLGVKFEVAGVKEAQTALSQLKQGLNDTVETNKKAFKEVANFERDGHLICEAVSRGTLGGFPAKACPLKYKGAEAKTSIDATAKRTSPSVSSIKNRGRDVDGQIIVNLNSEQFKSLADTFVTRLNRSSEVKNNRVNFSHESRTRDISNGKSLIAQAVEPIKFRIQSLTGGYFEAIGNYFGAQFATGLSETLEEELDYSQKRKGRVMGKTIGFVANGGMDDELGSKFTTLKETIADLANDTERVDLEKIRKALTALLGIPISVADSYLTGFRRSSIKEEAIRQVDKNKAVFNEDISDIKSKKKAIVTASGFAGNGGKQGRKQAERLRELNQDEDTVVLSSDTPYTDVMVKPTNAASGAAWGLNALANAASINLKGFNPDALDMVNKVLKLREENPDIDINLVGHSAGGFVVEEAQYLLEELGVKGTSATTIGTPNLKGGLKPKNIKRIFGENDPLKGLHTAAEIVNFVDNNYEKDSISKGHFFDQYLESPEVRKAIFNRQKYDNTGTRVSSDGGETNLPAEVASVVGDAIVTALETEGDLGVKAEAFAIVIANAATDFRDLITTAGETFLNNIKNPMSESVKDITVNDLPGQLDKLRKQVVRVLSEKLDSAIADYRRQVLKSVAAPLASSRAEEIVRQGRSKSGAGVSDRDKVMFIAVSGHHGREGMGGALVANVLREKTQPGSNAKVIWIKNADNDVPAESMNDIEAYNNAQGLSFAKPRLRGYSKDAVEGAAQALAAKTKNPNIEIKIVGFSAGTDVANEIVELLNVLGVKNVSGIGMGGPEILGKFKAENYKYYLSNNDPAYDKAKYFSEYGLTTIDVPHSSVDNVMAHDFNQYIKSDAASAFIDPGKYNAKTSVGKATKFRNRTDEYLESVLFDNRAPDLAGLEREKKILSRRSLNASATSATIMREAIANIDAVIAEVANSTEQTLALEVKKVGASLETTAKTNYRSVDFDVPKQNLESIKARLGSTPIDRTIATKIDALSKRIQSLIEVNKNNRSLKREQFTNYLRLSSSPTEQQLANRRDEYQNLDVDGRRDYISTIRGALNSRIGEYRTAIRNNNLVLAKEIAVSLLGQIAVVKQVYRDIAQSLPEGDELKNIVRGNQGYLTSVETEIIKGQPNQVNRGRIGVGLPDIFERQLSLADEGGDIVDGFIEGISAELVAAEEIGRRIVDATATGVREEGEIQSPSKLFARLGRFIAEGFRSGVAEISEVGEELEQRGREVVRDAAEGISEESDTLGDATENASSGMGQFFNSIQEQYPLLNKFKGVIGVIAGLFLGGLGINAIISTLRRLSGEALQTAMTFESLDRAIVFVSRSELEGMDNLGFISESAKRLSVDLTNAKQAYAGLIGAAKNTPIEGEQTKRLFSAFAESAANRGLDAQSQNRLFTALEQIIAKRQFSAEEVKGQIGDIRGFGDFQGILAQAQGVSSAELGKMMSQGEVGLDVVPKVVALIEAQNAAATGAQTAQQAQTQYNNSLIEFRNTLGQLLQPLQKLKLNVSSLGLDLIGSKLGQIFKLINITAGVALLGMFGHINVINLATITWTRSIDLLTLALKRLWASKMAILAGLGRLIVAYGLVTAAYLAWSNVIDLTKNQYQDLEDGADRMTAGIDRYREAIEAATDAQNDLSNNKPSLELNEGWELPDNWFGKLLRPIVGGDRLNLDNLVRKRWNGLIDRLDAYNQAASGGTAKPLKGRFVTEAERRDADRKVATGKISFKTGQLLIEAQPAMAAAEEINKFDAQIREIQAKRLELLPGDTKALEASLEEERAIGAQRDIQLKILTTYQQELQNAIALNKAVLANPDISDSERERAQKDLDDTEERLDKINGILSLVTKSLSEFQRQLRNSNERINNFIERRGLEAQSERTEIITEGVELGEGDRVIQLKLEAASRREISDYISELEATIAQGSKRLESGALAEGYRLVKESAEDNGLTLDSATIDRMLSEEGRSQGQKDALSELKALRENQTKLNQYREQLAQNIQTNRNSLLDFNRTIDDYFFRINSQIKEAQIEVLRIVNQIISSQIRNKLQSALSPNANSFVNQLISSTQSLLDTAASYAEKVLGQRSARIQFATTERSLQLELLDFARNVNGASDALLEFEKRLLSGAINNKSDNISDRQSTISVVNNSSTDNLTALRRAIIGKESGADFKAVNRHSDALGYGQVMPANVASWTKEALGKSLSRQQFLDDPDAQIKVIDYKLKQYLDRELSGGFDLDTAVRRVASTWYSGRPNLYNNTRPQTYGGGKYPSIDSYTKDILKRFKVEGGNRVLKRNEDNATNLISKTVFPIAGLTPDTANITSGYGNRTIFGRSDFHEGIDIAVSGGTPVVSTNSGVVKQIKPLADQTQVGIETSLGVMEWFIHLGKNLEVKKGDSVVSGQTIGYVANTSPVARRARVSTGDHLDYRVSIDGEWVEPLQFIKQAMSKKSLQTDGRLLGATALPTQNATEDPVLKSADSSTNFLIDKERQKLDLQDSLINNQELEALKIEIANNLKSDRQKIDFNITDSQFALDRLLDAGKDLASQYDFTTAASEAAKSIRAVNTAFSDRGLQISREIVRYTDEINAINDIISKTPSQVRMLRDAGRNDEADILVEKAAQAQLLLKPYQEILAGLSGEYENNTSVAKTALRYVVEFNKLKEHSEQLNRRSRLLNQKSTITEARGTLEAQRKVKAHQEDLRLALKINELRQQNAPGEYLDDLIAGERRQSRVNTENINYDSQLAELDLEKKLLDMQGQIDNKNAGFRSRLGNDVGSNLLKKNNAIALENLRFERELVELRKLYQDRPEELERFARAATELNRVNLVSIENEFKSLGKTIEDYFIGSTQGFFDKFVTEGISFIDQGANERQELEERLRYAEELNQLEQQNKDEPGKLAHLKNRARELNEEKLDKIRNEFNLFSRTVDLAKQAVMDFVKQLAAMVARAAAAKFLSSILGGVIGGVGGGGVAAVGNDYGSGAGLAAFVADKGMTVGDSNLDSRYNGTKSLLACKGLHHRHFLRSPASDPRNALSRKISDRNTGILRRNVPGIASAWSEEGSDARLGVFHVGEELLSRKTGEANRYQMLKREYGIDPLGKILNYSEGGTIGDVGSNVLSGFSPVRPRIDLSGLNSQRRNSQPSPSKTINITQQISTPNADSFRLNEDQRNQDLMERLRRGM